MVKKIIVSTLLSLLSILCIFPSESFAKKRFDDVPSQYSKEVNYLIDRNIIEGVPGGKFKPFDPVTREQAATMVGRALDLDGTPRKTVFTDVSPDSYASGFIQSANDIEVISGYGDGTFGPLRNMTRLEMAYLITKAFQFKSTGDIYYHDLPSDKKHVEVINQVSTAGITNGYTDGTFKPNSTITRVEFSIMLARALNEDYRVEPPKFRPIDKYVTASGLNVRSGPGVSHPIVGFLRQNDKVTVHRVEGDWGYITSGSLSGYVNQKYLTTNAPTKPNPNKRLIVIDPGHGGSDPGAIANGLVEKELNLDVSLRVRDYLQEKGYQVAMTRDKDTYPSLSERVTFARNQGADIFVSIHGNNFSDPSANGTETYYYSASTQRSKDSQKLASFIQDRLVKALGTRDRGVKHGNFQVIRETTMPAVLVELGFMSDKSDAAILKSRRQAAARAISQGIIDYFNWKGN